MEGFTLLQLGDRIAVMEILSLRQAEAQEAVSEMADTHPAKKSLEALLSGPYENKIDLQNLLGPMIDEEMCRIGETLERLPSAKMYFQNLIDGKYKMPFPGKIEDVQDILPHC